MVVSMMRAGWRRGLLLAGFLAIWAAPAQAISVGFVEGCVDCGFDNSVGLAPGAELMSTVLLTAGNDGLPGSDDFDLIVTDFDETASSSDPYTAQVDWTLRNNTGSVLDDVILLLTGLSASPDYTGQGFEIDLDTVSIGGAPAEFTIVQFTAGTQDFYYLGFRLQGFQPGAAGEVDLSYGYSLAGPLPPGVPSTPVLRIAGTTDFAVVPEPGALLLAGIGLLGLAWRGRKSRG